MIFDLFEMFEESKIMLSFDCKLFDHAYAFLLRFLFITVRGLVLWLMGLFIG